MPWWSVLQEDGAAGQFAGGDDVGDLEAEDLGVEPGGALEVGDVHGDVADLADAERQAGGALQGGDGVLVHGMSLLMRG